jgi:hypothetical protein
MANNKIYNLLPAHLQNKELETIFDSTLERAFSKGSIEKTKAFIGRKEKGVYSETDSYVSFPEHLFQRDNYGFEPVFSNTSIGDNIFYDDLLNSLYNKGALTNDHRRLFKSDTYTINLPIDIDKFINWELYYWVDNGFTSEYALYEFKEYEVGLSGWIKQKPYVLKSNSQYLLGEYLPSSSFGEDGDYAIVIKQSSLVYWKKDSIEGWARVGSDDPGASTFIATDQRPISPTLGDTYVNTNELRITLLQGNETFVLKDTIYDRWNIDVNPYALRFSDTSIGLLSLIEYRSNSQDSTPDWELYDGEEFVFNLGNSNDTHYITIDKNTDRATKTNWWSDRNSWFHYDDIRMYITDDSKSYVEQAKRPIIEFDKSLELSDTSSNADAWYVPTFKIYDDELNYLNDYKIFHYVEDEDSVIDMFLSIRALLTSGDYASEFTFNIDMPDTVSFKSGDAYHKLYIKSEFDYRNLRHEYGTATHLQLELLQEPKSSETIDVYVDGIKQIGNYVYSSNTITFNEPVTGYVYVDFTTKNNVFVDGDGAWQRIDPSLEYNPDNLFHYNTNFTFSTMYEHMARQLSTTIGLTGNSNGVNNYRNIGDNTDKMRNNKYGSVMVRNSIDIKNAYFSITRDDYNPFAAVEYLSVSYNNYKNKLITTVQEILSDAASESKSDDFILNEAIAQIALIKRENISVFTGSRMINFGSFPTHYITANIDPVIPGSATQFIPNSVSTEIVENENVSVYVNGILATDVNIINGIEISFDNTVIAAGDVIEVRYFKLIQETFIPPSATKLGISNVYNPGYIVDQEFDTPQVMIVGHDGSKMLAWGDRTDEIILLFEKLVYNRIEKNTTNTSLSNIKYGMYRDSTTEYSLNEKKFTMYPFFKKWMLRNNIDNLYNTDFDVEDYKTWNYRASNDAAPGYWRGIFQYAYGTETPLIEPWVTVGYSIIPDGFETNTLRYSDPDFWDMLKTTYSTTWPIPVDSLGNLKNINDLFFNSQLIPADITSLDQDWEFGDGSPVEQAWRRSSEYPFIEFLLSMITKPFEIIDLYSSELNDIIKIYHKVEGVDTDTIKNEQDGYEFKLGSKLGGFVNNFKLSSENSTLSNSRYTEIPRDNYDLFIHTGEPNRSESFSAIVIEKVSMDTLYPNYSLADIASYRQGDIVYNTSDKRYYKRKITQPTDKETSSVINFDYSGWTLVAQPQVKNYGYRINGFDEFNPQFYTMNWDTTSPFKSWSTLGDEAVINDWLAGSFYTLDSYTVYDGVPYVSLADHTGSAAFNDDLNDYWKRLVSWPRVNQVTAKGYDDTLPDQIRTHNYGDVLYSLDEIAQLLIGYQDYLNAVGWSFTDTNELGENVDFENLLIKFLDWSAEKHDIGEFITLTPILLSGRFSAPYGVASVQRETNKNFYRVLDSAGKQIPNTAITFYSDGDAIMWESTIPVYGMKIDIVDVEHAYVVDRVDTYGDVIYNPIAHNRNLRMIIDCNRTSDWDGTLSADGYIIYQNTLIPNFETMVADTKFHRDTIIDQSLSNVNLIKASHIGFTPRAYLSNHLMERESQLEFYKGFISNKGTPGSLNNIVNNNSNFSEVSSNDVWAFKLGKYGNLNRDVSVSKTINTKLIYRDPYSITYDNQSLFDYKTTRRTTPIKTTGYVDSKDVNYIVRNSTILETTVSENYYEGDLAWIQFDNLRDWDVRKLSEISEISYVGETQDSQLYIVVTSEIDTVESVYLRIINDEIDPVLNGYYNFVEDGTELLDGITVYKYLVFDTDFEPVTVEIDTSSQNSIFVPTSDNAGVEAISLNSNAPIIEGEVLVIDGNSYTYVEDATSGNTGITIGGASATSDPIVTPGEQISIVVYDQNDIIKNTNTLITFSGNSILADNNVTSNVDDSITINDVTLVIEAIDNGDIEATSTLTTSDSISSNSELTVQVGSSAASSYTIQDIEIVGTVASPTFDETKSIQINGQTIAFTYSGSTITLTDIVDTINASPVNVTAQAISNHLVITTSEPSLVIQGQTAIELGLITTSSYTETKLGNLAEQINLQNDVNASIVSGKLVISTLLPTMTLGGSEFSLFGFPATTYQSELDPTSTSIAQQINDLSIPDVSATVETGKLKIISAGSTLVVSDPSNTGSMVRLGFNSNTITSNMLDNIVDDINATLSLETNLTASRAFVDKLLISGDEFKVTIANTNGNPLDDLGISEGEYLTAGLANSSLLTFRDIINQQSSTLTASISSDGRFIITSPALLLSFAGTNQVLLDKIGFYTEYTSVTSNANFKVMRWKSVRFTPGYNGATFDEFYNDLGLNSQSKIWVDEYPGINDWAVLNRTAVGNLEIINRKANEVDVSNVKRVITSDGDDHTIYTLYDPLNLKLPGNVMKDIDYVDWNDPSKYDEYLSNDLWLEEHLGEIWWDTTNTRFYRYNDYGDANGNILVDYAMRNWGKIVDGSVVDVKQWVKNDRLPVGITWFNQEREWDPVKNKEVTTFYYWTSIGTLPRYEKEFSTDEIKMIIETGQIKNKFIPIDNNTIIINYNKLTKNDVITVTTEYSIASNNQDSHNDWELLSRESTKPIMSEYLEDFKNSIADSKIENLKQIIIDYPDLDNDGVLLSIDFLLDLAPNDLAISVNNEFLELTNFSLNGTELRINNTFNVILGDVIRVYKVGTISNSWYSNLTNARSNFASIVNTRLNTTLLETEYPFYGDYIKLNHYIFNSINWYKHPDYKEITQFEYLSNTRDIDMISMFNSGIRSFGVVNPEYEEVYFGYGSPEEITMVNKINGSLNVDFNNIVMPGQTGNSDEIATYYTNVINVQVHEFINMLFSYSENKVIKDLFFDMLSYMYTEKEHPEWLFKTSYIDLILMNKPLRQYAIYQHDTFTDTIEYVMEAKPYHVKLRNTDRIYPLSETVNTDVDTLHHMNLKIDLGGDYSRYNYNTYDGGIAPDDEHPNISDGRYEQGALLRHPYEVTADKGGIDTGFVDSRVLESAIVRVDDYDSSIVGGIGSAVIDKRSFIVYDRLGRGHFMHSVDTDTVVAVTNEHGYRNIEIADETKFRYAAANTVHLIIVENTDKKLEFMHYNKKDGSVLQINERGLFNGTSLDIQVGDTVHIVSTIETIQFMAEQADKHKI